MKDGKIMLLTFVSGNINGVDFTASGTGEADNATADDPRASLHYSRFPEAFHPSVWQVVEVQTTPESVALETDGGLNLYTVAKGNYDIVVDNTILPDDQVIYSSAQVRQIEPVFQVVDLTLRRDVQESS